VNRYIRPRDLLDDPAITLLAAEKDKLVFGRHPDGEHPFDVCKRPFAFISQPELTTEVAVVCKDDIPAFSEEAGDPKVPLMLLAMSGRSGSTLLTQMMAK